MKILVLGKYYSPYRGGIETLTRVACEGYARHGARVECVVSHDQWRAVHEVRNGVRITRCGRWGTAFSTPLCPGYLLRARGEADVIQLHFPNPLADLALCLRGGETPLVITYHSDIVRQVRWMAWYRPLLRWLLRRASRIVLATPPQLDHSRALKEFRAKCEIIPFGLDLRPFLEPGPEVESRVRGLRREADGRPILLSIGRLVGYKGQRHLIEALRRLHAVVWLVGTGPLQSELETLAQRIGVADRVRFRGELDEAQLTAVLHACDVFVLSSDSPNEAFGLVQVEAMACGKPVISCRLASGVPYVNEHGITGFIVPPGDAESLARASENLCADPALRARFGEAGRRRARMVFSQEDMIRRYWDLFHRVCAER
jgi:rhamnosyl/mannosyltransferase